MKKRIKLYLNTTGIYGLLCVIRAKMTHNTAFFKMNRQDCRSSFQLRLPSSDVPTYQQVFIDKEYNFLAKTPPKVIVDAGANIGLTSIYFANKYPEAKIIAIEPEQSNFELLKVNTAPYPNITLVQAALWSHKEEINLIDPGLGKWGFMTEMKLAPERIQGNVCHTVAAVTINMLMKKYNLSKIDILKIDIEGAEKEVFSDTSSWIDKVNAIIIELHESMKEGCNRSFYCGSSGFDKEWRQGDTIYLSKENYLSRQPPL
ncbi:MAG: FkbM family methyltransferase [Balneolales bacterium]